MIDRGVRQAARAEAPLIVFVLHKGADGFMSDADFRTFYWPTLKAVMMGLIEQGIVPAMFAEGGYGKRLEVIADDEIPVGSVLWMFDQTDMAAARRALGGHACIAGNVPLRFWPSVRPRRSSSTSPSCSMRAPRTLASCFRTGRSSTSPGPRT